MKLRAKSDHRIREFGIDERNSHPYYTRDEYGNTCHYKTLKEVADHWEDVPEEPKDFWFIDPEVLIACESTNPLLCDKKVAIETMKQIGNYFETRKEAERAVEKLKAWKRLKDKGFKFKGYTDDSSDLFSCQVARCSFNDFGKESREDLDLLFGGEE